MSNSITPIELGESTLARISPLVAIPGYDRSRIEPSIVHIGVGGFFRAHQARYLDELLRRGQADGWGYCGLNLLEQDRVMREVLRRQDGLYTLVSRDANGDTPRIMGSLVESLHLLVDGSETVIERLADARTRIVSLTITEGGYYLNEGTGEFNESHPDIIHDLAHPCSPRCAFGVLAAALRLRKQRGLAPFTLMSCDNLRHNGDLLRRMLLAFVELQDTDLARWIGEHCAFPNSMVDRITPATTDEHRALVREKWGINDAWPVVAEPFRQWVIEDEFTLGRPSWELVGAQITSDVAPYERVKMRLLNASHQAMCYIGLLLGYEFAHEAIADPQINRLVRGMMDEEVTPLLTAPVGMDLGDYKNSLMQRFANPAMGDQLARIATEGSARVPGFVLPSIVEQLERGGNIRRLAFTVACWFRFLQGTNDSGRELPVVDPHRERLMEAARRGGSDPAPLLAQKDLLGDLGQSDVFVEEVSAALRCLCDKGAAAALAAYSSHTAAED